MFWVSKKNQCRPVSFFIVFWWKERIACKSSLYFFPWSLNSFYLSRCFRIEGKIHTKAVFDESRGDESFGSCSTWDRANDLLGGRLFQRGWELKTVFKDFVNIFSGLPTDCFWMLICIDISEYECKSCLKELAISWKCGQILKNYENTAL